MLTRQNFGRRHQRGLLADLGDGCGRQQRDHGLAGADIALQQPQHAHRLAQIVGDGGRRGALRGGQRIGQRVDDFLAQMTVAGIAVAGRAPQLGADQRQSELTGEQFVEGKARPERTFGEDIGQFPRFVDAMQRLGDRRELAAADHLGTDPLRQLRKLLQRLADRAAQ